MAISVPVPKDLSGIKTKVALNLTKRQIICFSGAALVGIPLYFLTKGVLGTQGAALIMVGAMLPCDHCFLICDDLDMCVQCAAKLNERGTVVG